MLYAGEEVLPGSGNVEAEAFAFRLLVRHLQGVSSHAANIDIMNASGMCRNCVAKWYHAGALASGKDISYEKACEYVYGESYASWKQKYQKKASAQQLELYEATKPWHARHEKDIQKWAAFYTEKEDTAEPCCYNEDDYQGDNEAAKTEKRLSLGILTVSDRAYKGIYKDESGPALETQLRSLVPNASILTKIVPDEVDTISSVLKDWSESCDLILTTGGTGFTKRDRTPEATLAILHKQAPALLDIVHSKALQSSQHNLDSLLSRAVAGVRNQSLIVNLPGRPAAATHNLALLFPILLKATSLLSESSASNTEPLHN